MRKTYDRMICSFAREGLLVRWASYNRMHITLSGGNRCSNGRSTRCNMTGHSFAATIPPSATIAANKLQATSEREGGITGKADFTAAFPPRAQWTSWISMIPTTSG
jgi:hypothetical protein